MVIVYFVDTAVGTDGIFWTQVRSCKYLQLPNLFESWEIPLRLEIIINYFVQHSDKPYRIYMYVFLSFVMVWFGFKIILEKIMHDGTCVMPGSLTNDFLWSRWWGKRPRHPLRMRNPQFYVSGKRPIGVIICLRQGKYSLMRGLNRSIPERIYSISQEICTRFLLCCALLWLYIDWFSHIHQAFFTGTVAI